MCCSVEWVAMIVLYLCFVWQSACYSAKVGCTSIEDFFKKANLLGTSAQRECSRLFEVLNHLSRFRQQPMKFTGR